MSITNRETLDGMNRLASGKFRRVLAYRFMVLPVRLLQDGINERIWPVARTRAWTSEGMRLRSELPDIQLPDAFIAADSRGLATIARKAEDFSNIGTLTASQGSTRWRCMFFRTPCTDCMIDTMAFGLANRVVTVLPSLAWRFASCAKTGSNG